MTEGMRLPALSLAIGFALATALLLTTYTLPNTGIGSYPALTGLIRDALHDTSGALPRRAPPGDPIVIIPDATPAEAASSPEAIARESLPDVGRDWATRAVIRDSAALRRWLGGGVWGGATTSRDTVRVTVHRFIWRAGCPWFNSLRAVYVRSEHSDPRVVRLETTCPAVRVPVSTGPADAP